ncbi:MAG: hypothetical protein A2X22_04950 [Bacteroidetes bacterium GWF2_49_14]|nr:MAG: hypothetical protein A2X22_04950 [Bacteroidetes bacterium GWF2_49_14]
MFRNGDNSMFSAIYSEYSRKLYQYGLKFTRNRILIEDSIQDLFFELLKNRKTIGPTDNILRYLLKSFRNKLLRRLKQEQRYDLKNESEEYAFEVLYSFEHELILHEEADFNLKVLRKSMLCLTPRQKEAIYLKYTNGLKYEEVSEIMEMNLESCRNLICRAIKALREAVEGMRHKI